VSEVPTSPDEHFMRRALELARRGLNTTDPNPRVGCVLARGDEIVGEGWHERAGEAHAEVRAMAAAGGRARGATAYVSLEPCSHTGRTPPCADSLIAAGLRRVVSATRDPNPQVAGQGIARLLAAGIAVSEGVCEQEARELNAGFISRFIRKRPYVRLKSAASLDGRTALANGASRWITGEAARQDVQEWRARSSAIMTGAGTIRADDPQLSVRWQYGNWVRQPRRVVLDSALRLPAAARVFAAPGAIIFTAADAPGSAPPGVALERVRCTAEGLDLAAVLTRLADLEVSELLVECGPRLAATLLRTDLVDEWILYLTPALLGADARPLTALANVASMEAAPRYRIKSTQMIDHDLRLILSPR
jgi:diaminohydroxyphosphoribosylaminopyrimidine deaminase / 5-amino-6-(5-phosphoribosylamino)uracil reductase